MRKKQNKARDRQGLQVVTLCISTALVLILLGLVVFSVITARKLSQYMKQNIVVTMMLQDDMTDSEASLFCKKLRQKQYVNSLEYISKEQALKEGTAALGTNPMEFADVNPFLSSIEITLKADYANNDSLATISHELKSYAKVSEVKYQKDLLEKVNANLAKISIVLLVLAVLLTIVSFSLINNTVRLGIYAHRFSIHTMKLVGASWGFIRRPYIRNAVLAGLIAAVLACLALGGGLYALCYYEPDVQTVLTWDVLAITAGAVFLSGIVITAFCAIISVNKFLKMKAGDLYII